MNRTHFIFIGLFICLVSCTVAQKTNNKQDSASASQAPPPMVSRPMGVRPVAIIYKTKKDYYDKVFVMLSDDKTRIVSYPAPQDVYYKGQLAYPTRLNNDYLLDNRGVGKNSAVLSITYDAYSKLAQAPSLADLMSMIIDNDPFVEIYDCGSRYQYKDLPTELNNIIDSKQMSNFKKIL